MPVTRPKTGLYEQHNIDQTGTARFLFGDDEPFSAHRGNTPDQSFPTLVRREDQMVSSGLDFTCSKLDWMRCPKQFVPAGGEVPPRLRSLRACTPEEVPETLQLAATHLAPAQHTLHTGSRKASTKLPSLLHFRSFPSPFSLHLFIHLPPSPCRDLLPFIALSFHHLTRPSRYFLILMILCTANCLCAALSFLPPLPLWISPSHPHLTRNIL
jgi:hypothetical protein